ncbi:hypothetical protein [Priestia koreensis]|uniref:hypothetical protein n=1 Tax=Priestia koreensis TaxID=284581 RepID=UPI0034592234
MEWFPEHVIDREEECNPPGTVVVDVNIHSGEIVSIITVEDTSYTSLMEFQSFEEMVSRIETITYLTYGAHFKLKEEKDQTYRFQAYLDKILSPIGGIEVRLDENGRLLSYLKYGDFPSSSSHSQRSLLTKEECMGIIQQQIRLIHIPSFEEEAHILVYGLEELYIVGEDRFLRPYTIVQHNGTIVDVHQVLTWDTPLQVPFEQGNVFFQDNISLDEVKQRATHPDLLPISDEQKQLCIAAVTDCLRQEFPNDSGKWEFARIERHNGYIHGILHPLASHDPHSVFKTKCTMIVNPETNKVMTYINNEVLMAPFKEFAAAPKAVVTKAEAREKLLSRIELKPCHIFNEEKGQYVLASLLDCDYGVHAVTGELLRLADI